MTAKEIINTFKERTGISIIRATKEGVLKDYSVETEFPEILGAMLATVYGASVTAITDLSEGEDPVITIQSGQHHVMIFSTINDILAAFVPNGISIQESELRSIADMLNASDH